MRRAVVPAVVLLCLLAALMLGPCRPDGTSRSGRSPPAPPSRGQDGRGDSAASVPGLPGAGQGEEDGDGARTRSIAGGGERGGVVAGDPSSAGGDPDDAPVP
ncbi:MAG: hypothetical protein ACYTDY_04040 [Planctomycetota bacterium]